MLMPLILRAKNSTLYTCYYLLGYELTRLGAAFCIFKSTIKGFLIVNRISCTSDKGFGQTL